MRPSREARPLSWQQVWQEEEPGHIRKSDTQYGSGSCFRQFRLFGTNFLSILAGLSLAALLKQLRDQASPARLMTRANAGAIIAMEIFIEEH